MMSRLYGYVGDATARDRVAFEQESPQLHSKEQLEDFITRCEASGVQSVDAWWTYVVDSEGLLRLAPRRSEHVVCAGGNAVQGAGEMLFRRTDDGLRVSEVTNQSTGYCPDTESWTAIQGALDRLGLSHPGEFTAEFEFRRCTQCGARNLVKDGYYVCALCDQDLPARYNFVEPSNR